MLAAMAALGIKECAFGKGRWQVVSLGNGRLATLDVDKLRVWENGDLRWQAENKEFRWVSESERCHLAWWSR